VVTLNGSGCHSKVTRRALLRPIQTCDKKCWAPGLIDFQFVDGTPFKPLGDDPLGYLVYTPDSHLLVQFATRAERTWRGPEVLKLPLPQLAAALGFAACCGTFEVRDGQVIHKRELHIVPSLSGNVEARSVVLDDDRLILGTPRGARLEWERVH